MHKSIREVDLSTFITLDDWLSFANEALGQADLVYGHGTDNPWDDAVAIARYVLHLPVDVQASAKASRLTEDERVRLMDLLNTRIEQRIPVPYLTREAWFAGLRFFVDKRVLIPRSPLAELITQHFEPWIHLDEVYEICDLGTGSGCIAIACAKAFPAAHIDASDISNQALAVAKVNCLDHGLTDQVSLIQSDVFSNLKGRRYDVIISNPPYVGQSEMQQLPTEYGHEPTLALASGEDGLDVVITLLSEAANYTTDEGILLLEVGNSDEALQATFPKIPFTWLEFERGGHGVCLLTAKELHRFQAQFNAEVAKRSNT